MGKLSALETLNLWRNQLRGESPCRYSPIKVLLRVGEVWIGARILEFFYFYGLTSSMSRHICYIDPVPILVNGSFLSRPELALM